MPTYQPDTDPGSDALSRYVQGTMSDSERESFEEQMLENPLLSDAVGGLKEVSDPESVAKSVARIRRHAAMRVAEERVRPKVRKLRKSPETKTIWMYSGGAVAAVVVFLLAIFLFRTWEGTEKIDSSTAQLADNEPKKVSPSMAPPEAGESRLFIAPDAQDAGNLSAPKEDLFISKNKLILQQSADKTIPDATAEQEYEASYAIPEDQPLPKPGGVAANQGVQPESETLSSAPSSPVPAVAAAKAPANGNPRAERKAEADSFVFNQTSTDDFSKSSVPRQQEDIKALDKETGSAFDSEAPGTMAFDRVLAVSATDSPARQAFQLLKAGQPSQALTWLPLSPETEAQELAKAWSEFTLGQTKASLISLKPLLQANNPVYRYEAEWLYYEALNVSGAQTEAVNHLKIIAKGNGPYQVLAKERLK